ncbi:MAG: bifunctional ornithine acetyltransferase/N-acetylglutamate synthase [Clostridiales bacterium]|nr:bifunctional ornithine acetyltransferase/N-acetylglutamate synthase [Clostridiales bacterium]
MNTLLEYEKINGGVTAPKGFLASGIHCGLKKKKKDLALIYSTVPAYAAGIFTKNRVKAAPIYITKDHLINSKARAIICNSANANTCTGKTGLEKAKAMTILQGNELNIAAEEVLVSSTGIIGKDLDLESIKQAIPTLTKNLSANGSKDAASAILTTDKYIKELSFEFKINNKKVRIGAIAKGSGMVHPNMGTILSFITTDVSIDPNLLKEALKDSGKISYNRISVDGDTSTNDMVLILANGLACNDKITEKNKDYYTFLKALNLLNIELSKKIAKDGDGATKLIECTVQGAKDEIEGEKIAKRIITSNKIKASLFGGEINFENIILLLGLEASHINENNIDIFIETKHASIHAIHEGFMINYDKKILKEILKADSITIKIILSKRPSTVTVWGCDLSLEYIRITGDYRNLKGGY